MWQGCQPTHWLPLTPTPGERTFLNVYSILILLLLLQQIYISSHILSTPWFKEN